MGPSYPRLYGTGAGADVHIPLIKRGVVDFAVGADYSPSAGDVKVSLDGAAAANIATLPTALTMGNTALWVFTFSNAELQCKELQVTVADAATKAVEDQSFSIVTYGNASAMFKADLSATYLPANVDQILGTTLTESVGGYLAAAFKKLFDVATPVLTAASVNQSGDVFARFPVGLRKNTAFTKFPFMLFDSTTKQPAAGKTATVTRSIDGGAFAAGTLANVTEVAFGVYVVDFGAGDLNGNAIVLRAVASAVDDTFIPIVTTA